MEKNCFYTHNGVRGVLDYVDGKKVFTPETDIANTKFDYPEDSSCLSDEDEWDGQYNGETEIVETEVVNPQNTQKLIVAWVSEAYAESDEYERMLCVDTSIYHDWVSARNTTKDEIRRQLDKYGEIDPSLEEDWKRIVAQYSNTCGWDLPSIEFIDLINEVIN